jgi:hypothetical protein
LGGEEEVVVGGVGAGCDEVEGVLYDWGGGCEGEGLEEEWEDGEEEVHFGFWLVCGLRLKWLLKLDKVKRMRSGVVIRGVKRDV